MNPYIFATNNRHKLEEVRQILNGIVDIISLSEAGLSGEIPETSDTLQGNAFQKAEWVWRRTHCCCFADDTGLEVTALGGAPGVYSARYAGDGCTFDDNIDKLLTAMVSITDRRADFRTVVCLLQPECPGSETAVAHYFEGRIDGEILTERHGTEGFGYDPIFKPDRFALSFAEMPMEVKNQISHRGRAIASLCQYLDTHESR